MRPLRIRAAPETPAEPRPPIQRVLVVDDLPEICMVFRDVFRRLRHQSVELVTETSPQRAIQRLASEPFDVVVSDLRMRPLDGIHVLAAAHAAHPEGNRVLMTGYNEIPASMERIRAARVDAYVQKPLHAQELLFLLMGLLRRDAGLLDEHRRRARELEAQAEAGASA